MTGAGGMFGVTFRTVGLGLTVTIVLWLSSAWAISEAELRRVSREGPVEVAVTYLTPIQEEPGEALSFEVRLNTHSVDLDAYRMDTLSVLTFDRGEARGALGWFEPGGGGHHVSGILRFPGPVPSGSTAMRLIIRGVGSVPERVFEWVLPLE